MIAIQLLLELTRGSVQFSSVAQSCPTLRPHGLQHARFPCPSPTPGMYSNLCPSSWWCHPTISCKISNQSIHRNMSEFITHWKCQPLGSHQLNGREFEQTQEDSEGRGSLVCSSPWGCKESDTTKRLNNCNTGSFCSQCNNSRGA